MKTIKTAVLVSVLMFGMTTSVFASWWNPFTWHWFKRASQAQVTASANIQAHTEGGTTGASSQAETQVSNSSSQQRDSSKDISVHFQKNGYSMDPAKDWLVIVSSSPQANVDITGWTVRSKVSGKSFTIGTLPNSKDAMIGAESAVFVHTVGSPAKNYAAEGGEQHFYFGQSVSAWGKDGDTLELVNPSGVVIDTYTYPAAETGSSSSSASQNTLVKFKGETITGTAPLTVTFQDAGMIAAYLSTIVYGDGTHCDGDRSPSGDDSNWCILSGVKVKPHTYTRPGIYTVTAYGAMSSGKVGETTVIVK